MPVLNPNLFLGDLDRGPVDDLRKIEVGNFEEDADKVLKHYFKWKGGCTGLVGIVTSNDNTRVDDALFFVRGKFDDTVHRIDVSAIWEGADPNCVLQLQIPTGDDFIFSKGGLYSDFLPSAKIRFECQKLRQGHEPTILSPKEYQKAGVQDFALRMICQVSRTSNNKKGVILKYAILLYPGSISALTSNPGEQGASWPGIKIASGDMPLGPRPTVKWGCPFLPVIKSGTNFSHTATAPSGDRILRAISHVMAMAGAHDGRSNGSIMREKWERLRTHPEENTTKEPGITWPLPSLEPANSGRTQVLN